MVLNKHDISERTDKRLAIQEDILSRIEEIAQRRSHKGFDLRHKNRLNKVHDSDPAYTNLERPTDRRGPKTEIESEIATTFCIYLVACRRSGVASPA